MQTKAADGEHGLADRLAGVEIIAEIDGVEVRETCPMGGKPAPAGAAFAILLFAPVLRGDKLRLQRHGAVVTGGNDRGLDHAVEVFALAALGHLRTMRAVNLGGAVIFGTVQCDQYVMAQAQERGKTARVLQPTLNLFERRMEQ